MVDAGRRVSGARTSAPELPTPAIASGEFPPDDELFAAPLSVLPPFPASPEFVRTRFRPVDLSRGACDGAEPAWGVAESPELARRERLPPERELLWCWPWYWFAGEGGAAPMGEAVAEPLLPRRRRPEGILTMRGRRGRERRKGHARESRGDGLVWRNIIDWRRVSGTLDV